MARIVERIAGDGHASFLSVLKRFGPGNPAPLSFPMAGWTLALDLPPTRGPRRSSTSSTSSSWRSAGGSTWRRTSRVDRRGCGEMYPRLDDFLDVRRRVDPARVFQSDLSRRLEL